MCTWIVTVYVQSTMCACAVYISTTTRANCGKPKIPTTVGSYHCNANHCCSCQHFCNQPLTTLLPHYNTSERIKAASLILSPIIVDPENTYDTCTTLYRINFEIQLILIDNNSSIMCHKINSTVIAIIMYNIIMCCVSMRSMYNNMNYYYTVAIIIIIIYLFIISVYVMFIRILIPNSALF